MIDRYTLPPMRRLWGRKRAKFLFWLKVELAVLWARTRLGELPKEAYHAIARHARVNVKRIEELEADFDHDLIAFVVSVQESLRAAGVGKYAEEFHRGMTSYDTEDPALVLMLCQAVNFDLSALRDLELALREKAEEHKWTLMMMRTHGQDAEPSTFGHLLLVYALAVRRSINRLEWVFEHELSEGKISGAVGSYAGVNLTRECVALEHLGLEAAVAETQILQRDRFAMVLSVIATAGATIEQMARTFWEMMRSDARWLEEPRRLKQRGSSAMPGKKNPILTEREQGMARLLRGYAHTAMENVATPEGRDISQSSVERVILPDATAYLHYMATKAAGLVRRLVVFPDRMRRYVEVTSFGVWAGQRVRNALMDAGVKYDPAYLCVQAASFEAVEREVHLAKMLASRRLSVRSRRTVESVLGRVKLNQCFDAMTYIQPGIEHIFSRAATAFQEPVPDSIGTTA